MKFPQHQYQSVLKIIATAGCEEQDFAFVKRKGWIHLTHQASGEHFAYFKKKATSIDPETKHWVEQHHFNIRRSNGKNTEGHDWDGVLGEFEGWVRDLTGNN